MSPQIAVTRHTHAWGGHTVLSCQGTCVPAGSHVCRAPNPESGGPQAGGDGISGPECPWWVLGDHYSLEMVDWVSCGLLRARGEWDWLQNMRKRKVLACDNRATSWDDGGGSGERASLSGACASGTVACSRKNAGRGRFGCRQEG